MNNHYPVMLNEVVSALAPKDGEVYVDGTFGAGGYTRAFLNAADCTVIAIDRDPNALKVAEKFTTEFGGRFIFVQGCFGDALELVNKAGFEKIDGFVLDVGVSSMQIDEAARGFSFRFDGPLDMRMAQDGDTAADLVNEMEEEALANVIYKYGEERLSRRIAKNIVKRRAEKKFETTTDLADVVRGVVPRKPQDKIDPATRTFQALRIAVNDELGELERGLEAAQNLLKGGGRLAVVSFHSLEDGIVKAFMYERSGRVANVSKYLPEDPSAKKQSTFVLKKRKAVEASQEEVSENARSRSAKLRVAIRNNVGALND
jgi:16S rRNA (cytosine1402-N4)-methyltransferase